MYYSLYYAKYKISEIHQYLHPRDPEANVVIFKNKSDAEAVAKAMNKLAGIEL